MANCSCVNNLKTNGMSIDQYCEHRVIGANSKYATLEDESCSYFTIDLDIVDNSISLWLCMSFITRF